MRTLTVRIKEPNEFTQPPNINFSNRNRGILLHPYNNGKRKMRQLQQVQQQLQQAIALNKFYKHYSFIYLFTYFPQSQFNLNRIIKVK